MNARPVLLAALVVCWLLAGAVAFSAPAAAEDVGIENTVGATDDPGTVDVKTQVRVPSGTVDLEITVPEGSEVYETQGFQRSATDERTYEWTGSTDEPFVRYTMEGDVTTDRGTGERYLYRVTDEWAIVRAPSIDVRWTGTSDGVQRSNSVAGEGAAGEYMVFLGAHERHTRTAGGQQFELVVPAAADMAEDPADVLESLGYAAGRLDLGAEPDATVFVIAAPTDDVEWAATGLERGGSDFWVRDAERLDSPFNTWLHEFVHTRQDYDWTDDTEWTIEGMADYYAALLTYEQGHIDFETFRRRMADGAAYDDVRLADPATWEGSVANYDKGALVVGHIDRRLRAEHDTTVDGAVASFNDPDSELTQSEFLSAVESAGGSDVRADAEAYTETADNPPVWDRGDHVEAFGGPAFEYSFESYAASGPYRGTRLPEPRFVTGETMTATVRVENVGTEVGEFDADFEVGGTAVDSLGGVLDAGESTTIEVSYTFGSPGEFDLAAGGAAATAVVEEPAGIEVTDLTADPATAAPGEPVRLRATVAAAADRPADGEVRLTADGDTVATERVRFTGTTAVEATTSFDAPGEYTVGAGDRTATVTVEGGTATPTSGATPTPGAEGTPPTIGTEPPDGTPADGSAPGVVVAVAALAAALCLRRRA